MEIIEFRGRKYTSLKNIYEEYNEKGEAQTSYKNFIKRHSKGLSIEDALTIKQKFNTIDSKKIAPKTDDGIIKNLFKIEKIFVSLTVLDEDIRIDFGLNLDKTEGAGYLFEVNIDDADNIIFAINKKTKPIETRKIKMNYSLSVKNNNENLNHILKAINENQ